jgi:hypothetical protein
MDWIVMVLIGLGVEPGDRTPAGWGTSKGSGLQLVGEGHLFSQGFSDFFLDFFLIPALG